MKGLSKMGVVLVQDENAVGAHCPLLLTIHVLSLPGGSNNVGVRTYVQHLIHTLQCAVDNSHFYGRYFAAHNTHIKSIRRFGGSFRKVDEETRKFPPQHFIFLR